MTSEAQVDGSADSRVLCVDLDGTLLRTDSLHEQIALLATKSPWVLLLLPFWLLRGKASFKSRLSERILPEPENLPYNVELLDYLRKRKRSGAFLVLATAAPAAVAHSIAAHLGMFDAIIATDEKTNYRGATKAERLRREFGEKGFDYAGNDDADLHVWAYSANAIVVTNSRRLLARIPAPIRHHFQNTPNRVRNLLRAMRLHQWVKNVLIFVPVLAAGAWADSTAIWEASIAFGCFGLTASGVYLLNDLADLQADRNHFRKCARPFASGTLPLSVGIIGGPLLIVSGITISGAVLGVPSMGVLLLYGVTTTLYTTTFKTLPLVDVFILAGLYTLRMFAGGVATGISLSSWLLSFSGLLFLSLAFLKRYIEVSQISRLGEIQRLDRRGYSAGEHEVLMSMGIASAFASAIVLALYVEAGAAKSIYSQPWILWFAVPLSLFWLCRLWLSAVRGYVDDDPIVYAARDWVSAVVLGVAICIYMIALG